MLRQMVVFDEEKCTGCGLCAEACHEGAIAMVGGKARLIRDDYCDGMGNCLPACPAGAISFVMREAAAYDEAAVERHLAERKARVAEAGGEAADAPSMLGNWPVQIRLAPPAPAWLVGADVLVAADCTAYAFARFHERFMRGRAVLIGCTKLDEYDYAEKLAAMFGACAVRSVTVVRMDVPCCGGMERAVKDAAARCGREVPVEVVVIGRDGAEQSGSAAPQAEAPAGLRPLRPLSF
ncbi:MAG: 4Fe-4S binding protein [Mailhella sp.]|nr:4Fe-4S binding protein [Mailhella sp.]